MAVGEGEADPGRSAAEAARRAQGKIRRYCAANRLNRLGTLTYRGEGQHDAEALRLEVGEFFRRLRRGIEVKQVPAKIRPGDPFPYLWVPQWHPGGHGLLFTLACRMGTSVKMIDETYGHLAPDAEQYERDMLDEFDQTLDDRRESASG